MQLCCPLLSSPGPAPALDWCFRRNPCSGSEAQRDAQAQGKMQSQHCDLHGHEAQSSVCLLDMELSAVQSCRQGRQCTHSRSPCSQVPPLWPPCPLTTGIYFPNLSCHRAQQTCSHHRPLAASKWSSVLTVEHAAMLRLFPPTLLLLSPSRGLSSSSPPLPTSLGVILGLGCLVQTIGQSTGPIPRCSSENRVGLFSTTFQHIRI